MNLRPVSVVEVVQGKQVITSKSFTSTKDKHDFKLTLPPGQYKLRIRQAASEASVRVTTGKRQTVEFRSIPCA